MSALGRVGEGTSEVHCLDELPAPLTESEAKAELDDEPPIIPLPMARREAIAAFEREYLSRILKKSKGSVSGAARLAGVTRQVIHVLLTKHGLRGGAKQY
jgi:transcriptional regulator with GAF, ATPase, and Fis domain